MNQKDALKDARTIEYSTIAQELESALDEAALTINSWKAEGYLEFGLCSVSLDDQNDDQLLGWHFLGSVFSLTPSGKYYTPWANGNVEDCPRCKGKGSTANGKECSWCGGIGSREAFLDELWTEEVERLAGKYSLSLSSGEGDPTDLFLVMAHSIE